MVYVKLTFILFFCVLKAYTSNINETDEYAPHISAILKHLNSNPNKIYYYKNGTFISSQEKADIVELTIDVDVTCTINYPGVPCTEQVLTCDGFLQYNEGEYRVLSDVSCKPKRDFSFENLDELSTVPELPLRDAQIELSHEAVSTDQNADFVAIKADTAPCVGCPFDLNTNVEGISILTDTALRHIETERNRRHVVVKVIKLQQQVVAGIKYILIIEVASTVCQKDVDISSTNCPLDANGGSSVCEIFFLQKPWISKEKLITGNNCTVTQEYVNRRSQGNDMSNEISTNAYDKPTEKYSNEKSTEVSNKIEPVMDSQHLADLESQILVMDFDNSKPKVIGSHSNNPLFNSYNVQSSIKYEPFVVSQDFSHSINSTSIPQSVNNNIFNDVVHREQSDVSERKNIDKTEEGKLNETITSKQDSNTSLNEGIATEDTMVKSEVDSNQMQYVSRKIDSYSDQTVERLRRELKDTLRKRRDLDNTSSDSSESQEDNTGESIRHRKNVLSYPSNRINTKTDNSDSSSSSDGSSSHQVVERLRRELNDTSSSSSDSLGSEEIKKIEENIHPRKRRNVDNTRSDTSESQEDNTGESIRHRRNVLSYPSNIRIKRKRDNSDSSSSSDGSSSHQIVERLRRELIDTSSLSSESLGSEEIKKVEKNITPRKRRHLDNTSSDSSESQDNTGESIRHRKNVLLYQSNIRTKRKRDDSDSSSSSDSNSSSSSNGSNSHTKTSEENQITYDTKDFRSGTKKKHDKSSKDDSDSSSSSESNLSKKINEKQNKSFKDDSDSSSSSESNSSEKKNKKHNLSSDSSSSSSHNGGDLKQNSEQNQINHGTDDTKSDISLAPKFFRAKRSIGQLEKITQEEKFLVRDLADYAASSLDHIDDDDHKRVILQILSAKKLKLDGIYYHIILRLGISQCSENEDDENCREKLFTNLTKTCKVLVHVEDDFSNPKVVKSQCQIIKKDDRDRNRTNYSRYRRDLLVGAQSNISLDDPRILEFTRDTLTKLDSTSEFPNRHKAIKIVTATYQIVAGAKYKIKVIISLSDCLKDDSKPLEECNLDQNATAKICNIEVWDRPWLKHRETTVQCDDSDKEYQFENMKYRRNRSISNGIVFDNESLEKPMDKSGNLGTDAEESLDNQRAYSYLKDILNYLDRDSGHYNKLKIQDILSVQKQVVAGELWHIKARVTLTECSKSDPVDRQLCKKLEGSESRTCVFKIWDRPWLPSGREVQTTCENESQPYTFRLKRSIRESKYIIPSSVDNENEPNPHLLQYLKLGLKYIDSKSIHKTKYVIKNIKKVSKQTVAGMLWHVSAEISLSDCPKHYHIQYCDELENSESKICHFVIWEQRWLSTGTQINITCENDANLYYFSPKNIQHKTADDVMVKFNNFMLKHNKTYVTDVEYNYRLKVFNDNLKTIKLLNKYEQGTARYDVTVFADLTEDEFSKSHGLNMNLRNENEVPFSNAVIPDINLPTEFDWRKNGTVTEVKNQGSCGSCWAFSTTGNIEGQYAIKYGKLLEFSEQELVDCDKLDEGCNGGLMDNAYRTIESLGGLETESDYPYDAEDEKCKFNKTKVGVQLSGALNISHNEDDMAKWLVKNGPISIAINANAMQFYIGGVSHPWKMLCNPKNLDHGVLIVGYGIHNYPLFNKTLPYWIVKNSWGRSWGEQGYYRVFKGDGTCGLNQTPSSAIVA